MATLQNKLDDLEARLKAENESSKRDKMPINFKMSTASPRRPKPFEFGGFNNRAGLGGDALAVPQRRKNFQLPCSPNSPMAQKPPDAAEIEQKYQEIMKQTGFLTLGGQKFHSDISELEPLGELGHGTCGHVVRMRHSKSGHLMAVKQMRRSGNREENKRIIMDLDVVLKSLDCPYIVECLGTFVTSSDVWICMELMATCLEKLMKKLKAAIPENILGKVAVATVSALHYLKEEHGVIHRDVKPSNILVDEKGTIKLCDFGISGRLVDSKAKTRSAGCAAYMAPERIDPPDPTRPDYDIRADVWSLGISLVELATGEFPYRNCKTDFEVLTKVLQEDPPLLPPGGGFTMDFCAFVRDCLTKDYKKRPKYRKLLESRFIRRYRELNVDVAAWYIAVMAQVTSKNQAQKSANSDTTWWTTSPSPSDAPNPFQSPWSPSPNTPTPQASSKDFFITKPWTPSPAGDSQGRQFGGTSFPNDPQLKSWAPSPNDSLSRQWNSTASPSPHDVQGQMWAAAPSPSPSPSDLANRQWGPSRSPLDAQGRPGQWGATATPSPSPSPGPVDVQMRPMGTPSPSPMDMHRPWGTSSPSPADVQNRQWSMGMSRITPSPNSANMNTWPLPSSFHNDIQSRQWTAMNQSPSPSPSPIDANMRQWSGSPSPMDIQTRNWVTSPPNSVNRQWTLSSSPSNTLSRQYSQGSNSSTDSLTQLGQNFAQFGPFGGQVTPPSATFSNQMGQFNNQMSGLVGSQIGLAGVRKPWGSPSPSDAQQQRDLFMSRSWSPAATNNDMQVPRNFFTKPAFGN